MLARRAMTELGHEWWLDPLGRFGWSMIAREVALSERWNDKGDDVKEADHALSRDPEDRLSFEGIRALGEALAGTPVDALRTVAGVHDAASVSSMTMLSTELAIAEAVAHRELGDRPRAVAELQSLADAPAETMLYARFLAALELVQAHLDVGALDTARQTFEQTEALVERESLGSGRARLAGTSRHVGGSRRQQDRRRPALVRSARRSFLGRHQHRSGAPGGREPGRRKRSPTWTTRSHAACVTKSFFTCSGVERSNTTTKP